LNAVPAYKFDNNYISHAICVTDPFSVHLHPSAYKD